MIINQNESRQMDQGSIWGTPDTEQLMGKRLAVAIPCVLTSAFHGSKLGYQKTDSMVGAVLGAGLGYLIGAMVALRINDQAQPYANFRTDRVYDLATDTYRSPTPAEFRRIQIKNGTFFSDLRATAQ